MSVKCGHCGSYGQTVAHVKECSQPSVGRQHLISLMSGGKPVVSAQPVVTEIPTLAMLADRGEDVEGVYFKEAGYPEAGVDEGTYYKVVKGTNTGNWYAKEWVPDVPGDPGTWKYAGRKPMHFLTALDRVTGDEAARFGKTTGRCVFCSRMLTDERSIEVGYGPICAEREGLPWGEE